MSLIVKISAIEEKDRIVLYECTGKYSGDNKGGWGKPNVELTHVQFAQLEVYPPNVTVPIIVPVFPNLPTDDTDLGYELPIDLFSMKKVESGVWKFVLKVKGVDSKAVPFEKSGEVKEVFTKSAECCVDIMRRKTLNAYVNASTKDEKREAARELSVILDDALFAKCCGNYDVAQRLLKFINLQCECCG